MPLVTIVEEVMDFNSIEAATGVSHSTQFVRKLEAAGRSVVVFMLDHGIFTGRSRCRWYIAGSPQSVVVRRGRSLCSRLFKPLSNSAPCNLRRNLHLQLLTLTQLMEQSGDC